MHYPAFIKKIKNTTLLYSVVTLVFFFGLQWSFLDPILMRLNHITYDNLVRFFAKPVPGTPLVAVVDIDERSIEQIGRWPWPRNRLAQLVNNLHDAGVIIIAFDVIFADLEKNPALELNARLHEISGLSQEDKALTNALLQRVAPLIDNDVLFGNALGGGDSVLGYFFDNGELITKGVLPHPLLDTKHVPINTKDMQLTTYSGYIGVPPALLLKAKSAGYVSNSPDSDGIIRRTPLIAQYNNQLYASIALTTVMRYLLADSIALTTESEDDIIRVKSIEVSGISIPLDEDGTTLIPFYGPPESLAYYSVIDILNKTADLSGLSGAIVIIGSSATLLSDTYPTPMSQVFPGVEVNANIIHGILQQVMPYTVTFPAYRYYFLGFLLVVSIALAYLNIFWALMLMSTLIMIVLSGSSWLFYSERQFFPIAFPFLLLVVQLVTKFLYEFLIGRRQRNHLERLFGQYVPKSHIDNMMNAADAEASLAGESRNMTIFFADIRGFTTISEQLPAQDIKKLLSLLFTPVTRIIFDKKGTIDKYVGDMVMAFWGAPLEDKSNAKHAVDALCEIRAEMPKINENLLAKTLPSIQMGMGIATGVVNVGDMGSEYRRSYTVIGDTVNLASRLQDLTKFYGVDALVSESTKLVAPDFVWQYVDTVSVKGRERPLEIFNPLGTVVDSNIQELLQIYDEGITYYKKREFEKACDIFSFLALNHPEKMLYALYEKRCYTFIEQGVPEDWKGVWVHTQK